jgi:UDP-N-acetylmuramoylalanine--D-glutamate ligase
VSRRPALPGGPYLVVGLARSGVAAALALRARGQEVFGVDASEVAAKAQLADAGVTLISDEQAVRALQRVHTVIKSPGVPATATVIAAAQARGVAVVGELELAWRMVPNELIAVTGTNGKTTTVEWIAHIHRKAGISVAVAGNVGLALSLLAVPPLSSTQAAVESAATTAGQALDRSATVVCEASSFQLQDTSAFAPDAAVLLNLAPDHLDRHGSFAEYRAAKLNIFARQREGDLAVLAGGLDVNLADLGSRAQELRFGDDGNSQLQLRDQCLWWRGVVPAPADAGEPLLAVTEISLRGSHNVQNAMAAAAVCLARNVDPDAVRAGLRDFAGVAHRLQTVSRKGGVLYVNDSKATNVASTLVALAAFCAPEGEDRAASIHLILGGQGKGQDFSSLREAVSRCCRAVYLIGEDAGPIERALNGTVADLRQCGDLEHAVAVASAAARAAEVVLLSPACASFDQFTNFEARGERFRELVS